MPEVKRPKKAQDGCPARIIEEVCSATWKPLYRFIYYKVQNREEAEEVTQETYVRVLSRLDKIDVEPEKYLGFLKTVSLNILRDRWRKSKNQGVHISIDEMNPEDLTEGPAEYCIRRELLENALNMLSEEQRKVVELRIIKGYTAAEAGRLMNKKEGSVRTLQYRALKALTAILSDYSF